MITTQNAIKKLEKAGFKVEQSKFDKPNQYNRRFYAHHPNLRHYIELCTQGGDEHQAGEVCVIDLRTPGQNDDSMTDYHAGTFCDNITQAIRYATNWN